MGNISSYFPSREGNRFLRPERPSLQPQAQGGYEDIECTSDIYARLLLPKRRGYPLWQPEVYASLPVEYQQAGISIGDVGYIADHGCFVYLFNILLPFDDPRNGTGCLPPDFEPLNLSGSNIADPNQYDSGALVCNPESEIQKEPLQLDDFHLHDQPYVEAAKSEIGYGYRFTSSATEGALLVLPEGGSSQDAPQVNEDIFDSYIAQNALSWYNHINEQKGRRLGGNSLMLVTGVDKTTTWGVAAFSNAKPNTVSLELAPHSQTATKYWFRNQKYTASRSGPSKNSSTADTRNQCVFVRGIRVAVRSHVKDMEKERTYIMGDYMVTTTRVPMKHLPHHPSAVINDFLLKQYPEAEIALTHDRDWFALLEDGEYTLPNDTELLGRLRKKFDLTVRDGVVRVLKTSSR